jgi:hypothetical protein
MRTGSSRISTFRCRSASSLFLLIDVFFAVPVPVNFGGLDDVESPAGADA